MLTTAVVAALAGASAVHAFPALTRRQDIKPLSTSQIDTFTPYTWYASAAYCPEASATLAWNCGVNCDANSGFIPTASGGDGNSVQYWFVGYDPSLDTVIVAHQGTDPHKIKPILTDGDMFLDGLDSTLFPGISSEILVHSGFQAAHAITAVDILDAVHLTILNYNTTSVTMVGHSLGAALGLLNSIYLPLHLPSNTTFTTYGYGLPRVGNKAFADFVDANLSLTHINHGRDPVPTMPGRFMGYVHPAGEVHVSKSGEWNTCPGQDNPSTQCIVGAVPFFLEGSIPDHIGPYNGIKLSC